MKNPALLRFTLPNFPILLSLAQGDEFLSRHTQAALASRNGDLVVAHLIWESSKAGGISIEEFREPGEKSSRRGNWKRNVFTTENVVYLIKTRRLRPRAKALLQIESLFRFYELRVIFPFRNIFAPLIFVSGAWRVLWKERKTHNIPYENNDVIAAAF